MCIKMKKLGVVIVFLVLFSYSCLGATNPFNFLSKGQGDNLYCSQNIGCGDNQTKHNESFALLNGANQPFTGQLSVLFNNPSPINQPGIRIQNVNPTGTSSISLVSDLGNSTAAFTCGGSGIPQASEQCGFFYTSNKRTFQVKNVNVSKYPNASFDWGFIPDGSSNFNSAVFGLRIIPRIDVNDNFNADLFLQGDLLLDDPNQNKRIRTVQVDGGKAMVFDSNESLIAGGFPFVWVARDSEGSRIVPAWMQNGNNNSYGGWMNSFGTVPKNWVLFQGTTDEEGIEFLFNVSNYVQYCDWLQDNLSLVPEGCKYFADTFGRLVPLGFFGDLEVHRTATIHEGLLLFDNFDYISRESNDANFLWSTVGDSGKLHVRDARLIAANITFFEGLIANFDGGTIFPFFSESLLPEVGRDWASVDEGNCFNDRCANAKGGNEKVMVFNGSSTFQSGAVASANTSLSFYVTSILSGGDTLEVELDNEEGDVQTVYTLSTTVIDLFVNISFPVVFENKSTVVSRFILNGQNANRQVWVDEVRVNSTPATAIIINESYEGGRITFGQDIDVSSECYIELNKTINPVTQNTEPFLNIVCPNVAINGDVNISGGGGGGTSDHSALFNLDFSNSGHTGFASETSVTNLNVFSTITGDISSITADSNSDTMTLVGGGITSVECLGPADLCVIQSTEAQELWRTINADDGSTTANSITDAFTIAGSDGINTSITGDVVTVSGADMFLKENSWLGTQSFYGPVYFRDKITITTPGASYVNESTEWFKIDESRGVVINASGDSTFDNNVGIGTEKPNAKLHIDEGNILINRATGFGKISLSNNDIEIGKLQHNSDSNVFLTSVLAGVPLYLGTNDLIRMTIKETTGNVGIKTTNPGDVLTVVPTGIDAGITVRESDDGNDVIHLGGDGFHGKIELLRSGQVNHIIDSFGTTVFNEQGDSIDHRIEGDTDVNLIRVDASSDRVGIGVGVPTTKLDVNGDITVADSLILTNTDYKIAADIGNKRILFTSEGGIPLRLYKERLDMYGATNLNLGAIDYDFTVGANGEANGLKFVASTGNLGIGAYPNAIYKLDVNGNSRFRNELLINGNVGIGIVPSQPLDVNGLIQTQGGSGGVNIKPRDGTGTSWQLYNPTGDSLRFYGGGDKVTFLNNGNVGIGITNPSKELQIIGNLLIGATISTVPGNLVINTGSTSTSGSIKLTGQNNNEGMGLNFDNNVYRFVGDNGGTMGFAHVSDLTSTNLTTQTDRLVIDTSGNILIGGNLVLSDGVDSTVKELSILGGSSTGRSELNLGDEADDDSMKIETTHSIEEMAFYTSNLKRLSIDTSGNINMPNSVTLGSTDVSVSVEYHQLQGTLEPDTSIGDLVYSLVGYGVVAGSCDDFCDSEYNFCDSCTYLNPSLQGASACACDTSNYATKGCVCDDE